MEIERRVHVRVKVNCEMAMVLDGEYFSCQARNIASRGILARVQSGDVSILEETAEVACWLEYNGRNFEAKCRVLRIVGRDVALIFLDLRADQVSFVQDMIEENGE